VERAAPVTPKVIPAPKVPVTPPRLADIEEESQVWDARKLKPIGIGIAALLAISLSYVGVKALTSVKSPSVKSRTTNHPNTTLVEQPSPAAPPQVPATKETAAQIAKATESAGPVSTNPPNVPEAAQNNVVPPNQSPETAALTLTNPATEPGTTQNVAPQNQDAIGNAAAAQKQDAAGQSASRTQPGQPQVAAKQPENPSNASGRTRSGDSSTRSASSGQTGAKSSGAGHSTSRSSAASNAPPPSSARSVPRAPAPPKATGESRQRRHSEFEGSAPGG